MATKIIEDTPETLKIELNNGDLKALNEIVETWKFKDKESALRFALAVLKIANPGDLYQIKSGTNRSLVPTEDLVKE